MAIFNTEWEYLIHLLNAVIKDETPLEMPENLDFNKLFEVAESHTVANTAFYGIEKLQRKPEPALLSKWSEIRDKEIVKDLSQLVEIEDISEKFANAGIRFIHLKGAVLKYLYPQSDFRTMSDLDIYIEKKDAEKAGAILLENGYRVYSVEKGVHDVYFKDPVYNIEIHTGLFGYDGNQFNALFENLWEKATTEDGKKYTLTPEYFFAFLLAHGIKHYSTGGSGIRCFMDIYVYRKALGDKLDLSKVYELFEQVNERKKCEEFIVLSEVWFEGKETNRELSEMAEYIIRGGVYGSFENYTLYGMKNNGKWGFFFKRLFPTFQFMKEHYPILYKAPILLPFCWIVRIFRALTKYKGQTAEKFKTFKNN